MQPLSATTIAYLCAIAVAGLGLVLIVLRWSGRLSTEHIKRLVERQRFEAIETTSPLDDAASIARERGLESIEQTFTVTRRLVVPLTSTVVLFLAILPFLDQVPATVFSLLVAAVTVLVGIAARPFVENAIAGLVISSSRILNIGDTVRVGGHYGTVEDITVTHTTIKIWDWRRYVIPNATMMQREFENYSLFDRHLWAKVEFWVDYEADLSRVEEIAVTAPLSSPHFNPTEPPRFWVMDLQKDTIQCWVAAWAKTPADAWSLTHAIRMKLATELHRAGIRPHRIAWEPLPPSGAPHAAPPSVPEAPPNRP